MKPGSATSPVVVPEISRALLRVFSAYSRWFVRRRFHSIRVLNTGLPPLNLASPLVIYLNHAAWWDPLICLRLAQTYFTHADSYAPIDAAALQRYAFFKRLGFYGVAPHSTCGALTFLRTTGALLNATRNIVWLTPQGRFMDVRERPLRLQPGIGELAAQMGHATFIPLAIEYSFWTEPRPEVLISFGEPIVPQQELPRNAREWAQYLGNALEETQDELAARSCRRDAAEWRLLDRGTSGVNAVYNTWSRVRARVTGRNFTADHYAEEYK